MYMEYDTMPIFWRTFESKKVFSKTLIRPQNDIPDARGTNRNASIFHKYSEIIVKAINISIAKKRLTFFSYL